jgi:ParB-like chromosome segregation protein Spo0J
MDLKTLPKYEVKEMKLAELKDNPRNPRTIKDTALKGLLASIEEFGLIEPIIWNKKTGYIVGGHQRAKALREAGYTEGSLTVLENNKS